jgi:hypothetical protein
VLLFRPHKRTPAQNRAKDHLTNWHCPVAPEMVCGWVCVVFYMSKRLSATDISALASMKNVAKCDTWCELQNPVNHRVFERKLRPKPLGRGHVCLGVTQCCPPNLEGERADAGLPCFCFAVGRNASPRRRMPQQSVVLQPSVPCCVHGLPLWHDRPQCAANAALPTRPQVRRGYPLNLSISISGGKETYKDSPSNGERTGNSPG